MIRIVNKVKTDKLLDYNSKTEKTFNSYLQFQTNRRIYFEVFTLLIVTLLEHVATYSTLTREIDATRKLSFSEADCRNLVFRSLNNYTLILNTYDEISLFQMFIYSENINQLKECYDSGNSWLEFQASDNSTNISTKDIRIKTLKNTDYLLIIAEFNKESLSSCSRYSTYYLSAVDCTIEIHYQIGKVESSTHLKSLNVRFIENIFNSKIPLQTSSFLYAYEYKSSIDKAMYNNSINEVTSSYYTTDTSQETQISPVKFSNLTTFIKCDSVECLQKTGIFENYDFKTVYFKIINEVELDLKYNIRLDQVIMTVNNDQDIGNAYNKVFNFENIGTSDNLGFKFGTQSPSQSQGFLTANSSSENYIIDKSSINNTDKLQSNHAIFFKDITHLVVQVKNYYAIKLDYFPERFNLILTFSMKRGVPSKTEEKMMYRINNFIPFSKLDILSTVSPNFKILLYTVAAIIFVVLVVLLLVCFKCCCVKSKL